MNKQLLLDNLRNVPNFPIPGIQFKDVSTLYKNPACLNEMLDELVRLYADKGITKVVGIESRGFVIGAILASRLNCGFVMCRKPGKLPAETLKESYGKEYGTDTIEIHTDAITPDDVVLIHDDLLATGGSMLAAYNLVKKFTPKDIFINCIIELRIEGLKGREFLGEDKNVETLLVIKE
jgi:adenine phosphoribosyltransferase